MESCKDCIHYDKCMDNLYRQFPTYKDREIITDSVCDFFKNKADFVEVVRCEKCRYKDDCARQMVHTTRDYIWEQNISTYNKVDFCSYGEMKEGEK